MSQSLKDFGSLLSEYQQDIEFIPSAESVIEEILKGNFELSLKGILLAILKTFLSLMKENSQSLLMIVTICICCAICASFIDGDRPVAMAIIIACSSLIAFKSCIDSAYNFYENMNSVNIGVIPALGSVAVPVKTGVFLALAQLLIKVMEGVFMPAAIVYGILKVCNFGRFSTDRLAATIKNVFNWGLGIVMMVFSTVTAGAGISNGMTLSLALKTLKHTAGTAVPVVGRYISESCDVVASGAGLLKGAAGVGATVVVGTICITPFLELFAIMILFKLASVIVSPVLDSELVSIVDGIGEGVSMIMGTVALISVFSFLNIAVIAGAGVNAL